MGEGHLHDPNMECLNIPVTFNRNYKYITSKVEKCIQKCHFVKKGKSFRYSPSSVGEALNNGVYEAMESKHAETRRTHAIQMKWKN